MITEAKIERIKQLEIMRDATLDLKLKNRICMKIAQEYIDMDIGSEIDEEAPKKAYRKRNLQSKNDGVN